MTVVVSPADVTKIIIYNQTNADGTLTLAALTPSGTPVVLPTNVTPVWVFNTVNADGTLTSSTIVT